MTTLEALPQSDCAQMELPSMSSVADFHAKTFCTPARAQDLQASAADCGATTLDSLASYDPATSSWRTSQRCLLEGWMTYSETWPRSGSMRNGIAYRLPPLVPLTAGTDSGLWPTPTANQQNAASIPALLNEAKRLHPRGQWSLGTQVAAEHATGNRMWPTPHAHEAKLGYQRRDTGKKGTQQSLTTLVIDSLGGRDQVRGHLNPPWVEWLMGFPLGWTDCGRSAMQSCRKSLS
jgi:hypothetical protein